MPVVQPQRTVTDSPQQVGLSTKEVKGQSLGLDTGTDKMKPVVYYYYAAGRVRDQENCSKSWVTITHTFCHDQFHTDHDVCIYFVNPDPVNPSVIKLEVFDFHIQSSFFRIHYIRSVSDFGLSATFWIHQNLTGAVRFPTAPVLFTKQEMVCVIFALEYKFAPNMRCDPSLITAELNSCYKRRGNKQQEQW